MKRFLDIKNLTRLNILNKPLSVQDLGNVATDEYDDKWLLQADKIQTKRLRAWRHQLAQ